MQGSHIDDTEARYDWAQAALDLATSGSARLDELVEAAGLDPKAGDLSDIDLSDLDLSGQNLEGWDLRNAKFENTKLTGTKLRSAIVDPAEILEARDWENATLDEDMRTAVEKFSVLMEKVNDWEFSVRTANCLKNDDVIYAGQLVQLTEAQCLRIPNFGRKSLNEVKALLAEKGLQLGMELPPSEKFRKKVFEPLLNYHVRTTNLSSRVQRLLVDNGINYVGEVVQQTKDDLREIPGFGKAAINELEAMLARHNLRLGMSMLGWVSPASRL